MNKILVTCSFPYANGPIHIGHLFEYIQADIWVRYQKLFNKKVYFICADDAHGTAILLKSKYKKISAIKYINNVYYKHKLDFKNFNINFDLYSSTNNISNKKFINNIFKILLKKKYIVLKKSYQYFDKSINSFLSDRYIIGTCNYCLEKNQNNEICNKCNLFIKRLINPISILSNKPVFKKKQINFYLKISLFKKKILTWFKNKNIIIKNNFNKLLEWFKKDIKYWNISRNNPYFGIKIFYKNKNKFFYVWFDALLTYLNIFKLLCIKNKINFYEFWHKKSETKLYQFIGKDIIYFHCIFWPIILNMLNLRKPTFIFTHGYVNIKGKKMSKSNNLFISANDWIKKYDSNSLRFYYATKINNNNNDIDFNIKKFILIINKIFMNKIINLASRSSKFINSYFNDVTYNINDNNNILKYFLSYSNIIKKLAIDNKIKNIIEIIIKLSNKANNFFDKYKPWLLLKNFNKYKNLIHNVTSITINIFKIIMIYIFPIIPEIGIKVEHFLNIKLTWENLFFILKNHKINKYKKLYLSIKY